MIYFFTWVVLFSNSGLMSTFVSHESTCTVLYVRVKEAAASSRYKHIPQNDADRNR